MSCAAEIKHKPEIKNTINISFFMKKSLFIILFSVFIKTKCFDESFTIHD
jgi:hypothetical protein